MRFFCTNQLINYPDDAVELRATILNGSTVGPQKRPLAYFQDYLKKGGTEQHPLLGSLLDLANEIEAAYGIQNGINLVSEFLRSKFEMRELSQENLETSLDDEDSNSESASEFSIIKR